MILYCHSFVLLRPHLINILYSQIVYIESLTPIPEWGGLSAFKISRLEGIQIGRQGTCALAKLVKDSNPQYNKMCTRALAVGSKILLSLLSSGSVSHSLYLALLLPFLFLSRALSLFLFLALSLPRHRDGRGALRVHCTTAFCDGRHTA